MSKKQLTDKQERFCQEYLIDLNATQAAVRTGYSAKTANEQGSRLLANVSVQRRINELKLDRQQSTGITAETVIKRINEIAIATQAEGDNMAALKANELLGKHFKLFTDKVEQSGNMSFTVVTNVPDAEKPNS